ncbi:unnamed protein product [Chrysodeixis includens]|uniref:Uncharacterized protein n=1 Tax=Chrysodeixis includens TaxID=689277 RepID=A0A9P0FWS6_CHRIL|nr:unnamed protein product [Chrysodeixis includens]
MDTTTSIKPKTMAELLPGLSGILSKDTMQTLTSKKQPRQTIAQTRTTEKVTKPLTIAEMRADILALRVQSPRRYAQGGTTSKKKIWNSSVKVDKTVSHTANGQMKHNPVRKVLNFQPKSKPAPTIVARKTLAPESPKFTRPDFRAKKSLLLQARTNVRISGICNISETPLITKPAKSRMTLANKENISNQASIKKLPVPKPVVHKKLIPVVPDTPLSNESWKSSCDASFLENEKEINDVEAKTKAIAEEPTLENIAEVTPPVSTPFKDYRNVKEYFNNSSEIENSAACNDDTIMCFEKHSLSKENNHREESVIVSLCDLLNKATVTNNSGKMSTELEDLLQIEEQTERNLLMIDNSIAALNKIKESQLTSLKYVRKLITEKKPSSHLDATLTHTKDSPKAIKMEKTSPKKETLSKPCSVIKTSCSKSPSYKIPKKNLCLRKKVFHKSMPNVSSEVVSPVKADMGNRALSMYMKMKEQMNFLNTPVAKRNLNVPDTPAVTSHNLQKQLDKLYDEN